MSHANAALIPRHSLRIARLIIDDGWAVSTAAKYFHVFCVNANRKWGHFRFETVGLRDTLHLSC